MKSLGQVAFERVHPETDFKSRTDLIKLRWEVAAQAVAQACDPKERLKGMTSIERVRYLFDIMDGYCLDCGQKDETCHCTNDE